MRLAACVEYDGSRFHGWQTQDDVRSVQQCVEQAISKVANHPVTVICAGRTDTGVHSVGQIIHFDSDADRSDLGWLRGSNSNLPREISLTWVKPVAEDFHARFTALARRYRYAILNRAVRPSFLSGRVTWEFRPLDVSRMAEACQYLLGEHDFSSYRAVACQSHSPVRNITLLEVSRCHDMVFVDIKANAFLHHMVRNIVGVLCAIGAGEQPSAWAKEVLDARDRRLGGVTAPPSGLYFMQAYYPERFVIPRAIESSMVW